jgi:hypothetical protein
MSSGRMLERIVYISASRIRQTEKSVAAILSVARARNTAAEVTGLLLGGGAWWLQLLEGERPKLEPVWQSIRSDPRHNPVLLVQRRPIRRRGFGDWAMQYRTSEGEEFDQLVEELTGGITDPRLRDQLLRFSRIYLAPDARPFDAAEVSA